MSNADHPEHLQKIIREFVEKLGFPESPKENGQDFDEKLTASLYVLWHVLARICGIASLDRYHTLNPDATPKDMRAFIQKCVKGSGEFHAEFLNIAGKMTTWEPPAKKPRRKRES